MSWQALLGGDERRTLPWAGGREIVDRDRRFTLGKLPPEHGWHVFQVRGGRRVDWVAAAEPDPDFDQGRETRRGWLVGDRLVPDDATVVPDLDRMLEHTLPVRLVEPGLDRFARVLVARAGADWFYVRPEFPLGPEADVIAAWEDGRLTVADVPGVPPGLDLAFRILVWQRMIADEERRRADEERELERMIAEEDAIEAANRKAWAEDWRRRSGDRFEHRAREALRISGAELLDVREAPARWERIVRFRFRRQRFECVVDHRTLRIVDSGVCLVDHDTGERGDRRFTLESLPGVLDQAMREGRLVVFRHA